MLSAVRPSSMSRGIGIYGHPWSVAERREGEDRQSWCWHQFLHTFDRIRERSVLLSLTLSSLLLKQQWYIVYALGSGEHGQLGNGRTGEHIATGNKTMFDVYSQPGEDIFENPKRYATHPIIGVVVLVKGLEGNRIVQISCGHQHSIALDSEG